MTREEAIDGLATHLADLEYRIGSDSDRRWDRRKKLLVEQLTALSALAPAPAVEKPAPDAACGSQPPATVAWTVETLAEAIKEALSPWHEWDGTCGGAAIIAARIALRPPASPATCGTCKGTGRKRTLLEVGNGAETWQDEPCPRCTNPATGGV